MYSVNTKKTFLRPNLWDWAFLVLIFSVIAVISWEFDSNLENYQSQSMVLNSSNLFSYSIKTITRMLIALVGSVLFTLIVAPIAAKNKHVESVVIPIIDILESLPILTITAYVFLFAISTTGSYAFSLESAAISAVFFCQVWNMTISMYQSIKTLPKELKQLGASMELSSWQKFWHIELAYSMPGLITNCMISMSAGWFYIVESEALTIANKEYYISGIGSYLALAITQQSFIDVFYVLAAVFIMIMIYDQIIFRPLLHWGNKFKYDQDGYEMQKSPWFYHLLQKTRLIKRLNEFSNFIAYKINNLIKFFTNRSTKKVTSGISTSYIIVYGILGTLLVHYLYQLIYNISPHIKLSEILNVLYLSTVTGVKVMLMVLVASVIWVPIGVKIGLSNKLSNIFEPITQFLAAIPAQIFYPFVTIVIINYDLSHEIFTTPIMIIGTQWYILFNVIIGTKQIPYNIRATIKAFDIKGVKWWTRYMLPAIYPYYITGAMAAAGGCWNASLAAEFLSWGDIQITSTGIGSYIKENLIAGDMDKVSLGLVIMTCMIILINRLIWHKMYDIAEKKYSMNY